MTRADVPPPSTRLVSLDAFRGATIALMVLVNTAGDGRFVYAPLRHSAWHGWTLADVVFPSFLWIMGVAMTLSLTRRLALGATRPALLAQAARRALVLYALGLLIYAWPSFDLSTLRLLGVLQRIAICSLAGAAIWLSTGPRGRMAWIVGLLAGYWALMVLVPVPGYGTGRLDVDGNLAHYVDRVVLGAHNYARTRTWDPEGLVSTVPAVATVLFGMLAGGIVTAARPWSARLGRLLAVGVVLIACGLLCDLWLPINKKLWTSSFALFMAGLDAVLLAFVCWAVDVRGWRRTTGPLVVLGMNAIAVYMMSELLDITLNALHLREPLYATFFAPLAAPLDASLLYAVAYTGLMFAFAWALHRRGWYLKV